METPLNNYWKKHPLIVILIAGFLIRLIAVLFSKGYGMHDDHFLVIEVSQSWVDGTDYNYWLPTPENHTPSGHSFFYPGLHFLFLSLLQKTGITDPQAKMFFVRFAHLLYSLLIIILGYKITEEISSAKTAVKAALLLSVYWFFPFLSVRNLIEYACIPPLMAGIWMILRKKETENLKKYFFIAGIITGLAFSIRFQTAFFIAGIPLVLLLQKKLKEFFWCSAGVIVSMVLIQGTIDLMVWGIPFNEFTEYVRYNWTSRDDYGSNKWYLYPLFLSGILIPPVSLVLFAGFLSQWKKHLLIFLPVMIFFLFHELFPNKQERFILPIIPFIIISGIAGWDAWVECNRPSKKIISIARYCWIFFWIINLILLPFASTTYSKRSRVEAMSFLFPHREHLRSIVVENSNESSVKMMPRFYCGKWIAIHEVTQVAPMNQLRNFTKSVSEADLPQFSFFIGDNTLNARVDSIKTIFPRMKHVFTAEPSFVDHLLFVLNPRNRNEIIYIYRNF